VDRHRRRRVRARPGRAAGMDAPHRRAGDNSCTRCPFARQRAPGSGRFC
jgi:hypothetical protein